MYNIVLCNNYSNTFWMFFAAFSLTDSLWVKLYLGDWALFSQFSDYKRFCSGTLLFCVWQYLCKIKHDIITWRSVFISISMAQWRNLSRVSNLPNAFSMAILALDHLLLKYFSLCFSPSPGYSFIIKGKRG